MTEMNSVRVFKNSIRYWKPQSLLQIGVEIVINPKVPQDPKRKKQKVFR